MRPVTTSSTCNRELGTGICERWKRLPVLGSAPSLTEFNGYSCWIKTTHGSALSGEVSGCAISRAQLALSSLSGCLLLTCLIIGCKLAPASYVHQPARVYSRPLLCSLSCCRGRHVLTCSVLLSVCALRRVSGQGAKVPSAAASSLIHGRTDQSWRRWRAGPKSHAAPCQYQHHPPQRHPWWWRWWWQRSGSDGLAAARPGGSSTNVGGCGWWRWWCQQTS
eukprot:COSAG06_NODE_717_length_12831_cov_52.780003_9_plen_221_part_00